MIDLNESQVICGFPGVGKSTLFKLIRARGIVTDRIIDSDSSTFDKSEFPQNYMSHIRGLLQNDYVVLASTHRVVRDALHEQGIPFKIAYPAHIGLKDEYIQRYIDRGSPEAFVNLMRNKWEEFYLDVSNDTRGEHLLLAPNCYLSTLVK